MTTTEIFLKMVDWIVDNTTMQNPTDVARKAGLNASNFSKIKIGINKTVKYETMQKLNNAFGNPFNPDWMRGKSDVMLVSDIAQNCSETQKDVSKNDTILAILLAAKDEAIDSLKRELAAKDETITAKDCIIDTKDKLIDTLQQQIDDLRMQAAIEKGAYTSSHKEHADGMMLQNTNI